MGFTHTILFETYSVDRQRPLRQTDRPTEGGIINNSPWPVGVVEERERQKKRRNAKDLNSSW